MNKALHTKQALIYFEESKSSFIDILLHLNNLNFDGAYIASEAHRQSLESLVKANDINNEAYLNDIFILKQHADFNFAYCKLWQSILCKEFSNSWGFLQDTLDILRTIKKFSGINLVFFEDQLIELESAYPYRIFFSIGTTAEYIECSICNKDIDSFECLHRKGELYEGKLAHGIAKINSNSYIDHVAMVKNPKDKRCVIQYDDTSEEFKIVRYLSRALEEKKLRISDFKGLKFSKIKKINPNYKKQKRNDGCACGSGKKFKKCCGKEAFIEHQHVDIVTEKFSY